jgi:hypothetical protein
VLTELVEARHPTSRPAFPAADGRHALTLDLDPRICVSQCSTRRRLGHRPQHANQTGARPISVGHEDLRVEERFLDSSTPHPEVFLMSPDAVTNVRGQYT